MVVSGRGGNPPTAVSCPFAAEGQAQSAKRKGLKAQGARLKAKT
jgi:hypothetical protein